MEYGKLIVVEGTDCSGKETQTNLLIEKLRNEGLRVKKYSFPNYDDKYGNIDCFDAFFSLLTTAIKFIKNKNSISLTRYSICCHRCLLNSYQKHNYREALIRIKSIARLGHKLCLIPRMKHIQRYNYWLWHFFLILYTLKKK